VLNASGWLNAEAPENIKLISVTLDVLNASGWLNAEAPENMAYIVVTCAVLNASGWLNDEAPSNMCIIIVTLDVSHLSIDVLNVARSLNSAAMSVTIVTSHVLGSPWCFSPRQYSSIHVRSSCFVAGFGLLWPGLLLRRDRLAGFFD